MSSSDITSHAHMITELGHLFLKLNKSTLSLWPCFEIISLTTNDHLSRPFDPEPGHAYPSTYRKHSFVSHQIICPNRSLRGFLPPSQTPTSLIHPIFWHYSLPVLYIYITVLAKSGEIVGKQNHFAACLFSASRSGFSESTVSIFNKNLLLMLG